MQYRIGTLLDINGIKGQVIGFIEYYNPLDEGKKWYEYRMKSDDGEWWLSYDDDYNEYSVSWPANDVLGRIGPEWIKVDEGRQVVVRYGGDVDVDPGERATFVEYEDSSQKYTLSVEIWSDGTEYSKGRYVEKQDIKEVGFEKVKSFKSLSSSLSNDTVSKTIKLFVLFFLLIFLTPIMNFFTKSGKNNTDLSKYVDGSVRYIYETSISGNENQKAKVYSFVTPTTLENVAKDIIDGIEGNTESVTQNKDVEDGEIAILTSGEYCLIYHPEEDSQNVYVQVSNRKYNYTSDNAPYRSSNVTTNWYRKHYYSSGYSKDSTTYKKSASAYKMYSGDTIHNIGNGYFDSYSKSVKQSSVNNRHSSGGGISSGK